MGNVIKPEVVRPGECLLYDILSGDLKSHSVAICTDREFGLASKAGQEFLRRYGGVEYYKDQNIAKGNILTIAYETRFIYLLVISDYNYERANVDDLNSCLALVKTHANNNGVTTILFENVPPKGIQNTPYKNAVSANMGGMNTVEVKYFELDISK